MAFARGKMQVQSVDGQFGNELVKFTCSYDPDDPEDTKFFAATPSGSMELYISNPNLLGQFIVGSLVYVDLTLVED